jgi:hypothetical protein
MPGGWLVVGGLLGALGLGCGDAPQGPAPEEEQKANRPPVLLQVTAERTSIDEGSGVRLIVDASDPDGDPLAYAWIQSPAPPLGTFKEDAGSGWRWTAPFLPRDTEFVLRVTVSDGKGGSVQGSVPVRVINVPALNHPPDVYTDISVDAQRTIPGDLVRLFIGASDQDGDALTYAWATEPAGLGVFTNANRSSAEWRAPESATATAYSLRVTVSDGASAVTRSVRVYVSPPSYAQDIQPIWDARCADCHNAHGSEGLNLESGASYASLVNVVSVGGCRPMARVTPGKLDESLLVWRLTSVDCGPRMPLGGSDYFERNPGELIRIRSWIRAGAPNN